jgi:hypothetical protein
MFSSTMFGFDPVETILAEGPFTFAKALAFAAMRAEMAEVNDDCPESKLPTLLALAA